MNRWFERAANALASMFSKPQAEQLPKDIPALTAPTSGLISSATVSLVRDALEAHESGSFNESSQLVRYMLRDADLQAALLQRVLALLGLPFEIEPADDSEQAVALAKECGLLWSRMVPLSVVRRMLREVVMMGFFVGVIRYRYHEDFKQVIPTLEAWPSEYVYHCDGEWFAIANEGTFKITPGDGRWVLWTPDSPSSAWDYGAVRALALWVLRAEHVARDASRWSETKGQGIWLAKMPANASETVAGKAYLRSVQTMGRAPVVPLPRGMTPEQSYDLSLVESQSNGWEGFDFLLQTSGRKIRLAILGQDMTSVSGPDGGSYAQSKIGNGVREDVLKADAKELANVLREQVLTAWVRFRAGDVALTPFAFWNATPPEDLNEKAAAQASGAAAIAAWLKLGVDVDVVSMANRYGVELLSDELNDGEQPGSE